MNATTKSKLEAFIPLTISNVHREYPNGIAHRLFDDADEACRPSLLHPAFYGCYDWHSAVHSHWQVVRAIRLFSDAAFVTDGRAALNRSLTHENIVTEVAYLHQRQTYEMPYGMAWLLQLTAELREWAGEDAQRWLMALKPLEDHAAEQFRGYLNKMEHPVRTGAHNQTAFSLGLVWDWAAEIGDRAMQEQIRSRAIHYFENDTDAPFAYEPSGTDFLSPTLGEADLMRRLLEPTEYANWLARFMGANGEERLQAYLQPVEVGDFSDGQLAHFAGLNMSRAWMLQKIAAAVPLSSSLATPITRLAQAHRNVGLGSALHKDYMVSHWAPTFVVYLLTER